MVELSCVAVLQVQSVEESTEQVWHRHMKSVSVITPIAWCAGITLLCT